MAGTRWNGRTFLGVYKVMQNQTWSVLIHSRKATWEIQGSTNKLPLRPFLCARRADSLTQLSFISHPKRSDARRALSLRFGCELRLPLKRINKKFDVSLDSLIHSTGVLVRSQNRWQRAACNSSYS